MVTHTVQYIYTLPFKSLGSLKNVLVFERKALFVHFKITFDQKYTVDIVNVVNGYCSWKRLIKK
jgi:hypothetical protein